VVEPPCRRDGDVAVCDCFGPEPEPDRALLLGAAEAADAVAAGAPAPAGVPPVALAEGDSDDCAAVRACGDALPPHPAVSRPAAATPTHNMGRRRMAEG